ncbi:MAG: hypothetical protein WC242_03110 [Candidatus Paceibacterota bacterium]|jgi:hypothetical protein
MLKTKRAKLNIKKILANSPEGKVFWTSDKRKLYNIRDFIKALETMDDLTFRSHVNSKKNDFARWINLVLGDKKLSRTLRWTTTRATTIQKTKEHLKQYYI